jgi:hypothetical protein
LRTPRKNTRLRKYSPNFLHLKFHDSRVVTSYFTGRDKKVVNSRHGFTFEQQHLASCAEQIFFSRLLLAARVTAGAPEMVVSSARHAAQALEVLSRIRAVWHSIRVKALPKSHTWKLWPFNTSL